MKLSEEIKEDIRFLKKHDCEFNFVFVRDKLNYYLPKVEKLEKEHEELLNALIEECKNSEYYGYPLPDSIKLIEKIKNKSWEEICK